MVAVFIGQMWYWYLALFHQRNPLDLPTEQQQVTIDGEFIHFDIPYCLKTRVQLEITRSFVDGVRYTAPTEYPHDMPMGCHVASLSVPIPSTLAAGEYHMETVVHMQVNPFARREARWETVLFSIE